MVQPEHERPNPLVSAIEYKKADFLGEVSDKIMHALTAAALPKKNALPPLGGIEIHQLDKGYSLTIVGPLRWSVQGLYHKSSHTDPKRFKWYNHDNDALEFQAKTLPKLVAGVNVMLDKEHQIVIPGLGGHGIA